MIYPLLTLQVHALCKPVTLRCHVHVRVCRTCLTANFQKRLRKEKKRKDCAFRRQFIEKPRFTLGCPGANLQVTMCSVFQSKLASE